MKLNKFSKVVREAQQNQKRTNTQLACWLMTEAAEVSDLILKEDVYGHEVCHDDLLNEVGMFYTS